jgi:hypothetical protein
VKGATEITPLPEALDGQSWTVEQGDGKVDLQRNQMEVPLGNNAGDFFVRLHEMGHARFTPKTSPLKVSQRDNVSIDAIQVCEDARIHVKLLESGCNRSWLTGGLSIEEVEKLVSLALCKPNAHRELGRLLVGSYNTDDHTRILIQVKEAERALGIESEVERAHSKEKESCTATEKSKVFSQLSACQSAREMAGIVIAKHIDRVKRGGMTFKNTTIPAAKLFDTLFPVAPRKFASNEDARRHREFTRKNPGKKVPWARMIMLKPSLKNNYCARKLGKTHRATDSGSHLRGIHRLATDGAIFTSRKRVTGGTLLLDASGSMSITEADIQSFLKVIPHGQVAIYAGGNDGETGHVVIVAARGRCVSEKQLCGIRAQIGQRNLIDGPALQWLAAQPGKRVWVSDGYVTGYREQVAANLIEEVNDICLKNGIQRIFMIDDAVDLFKRGGSR